MPTLLLDRSSSHIITGIYDLVARPLKVSTGSAEEIRDDRFVIPTDLANVKLLASTAFIAQTRHMIN